MFIKAFFYLFLIFLLTSCGIVPGDKTPSTEKEDGTIFTTPTQSFKVVLESDAVLASDATHYLSLKMSVSVPKTLPKEANSDPDHYFKVTLTNTKSPNKDLLNKSMTLIFGRMGEADQFKIPQDVGHPYEVSILNWNFTDNRLKMADSYNKKFWKSENTLPLVKSVYKITNVEEGCSMYCVGETAIFNEKHIKGFYTYTFIIYLYNKFSPQNIISRDHEEWKIKAGLLKPESYAFLNNFTNTLMIQTDKTKDKNKKDDLQVYNDSSDNSFNY